MKLHLLPWLAMALCLGTPALSADEPIFSVENAQSAISARMVVNSAVFRQNQRQILDTAHAQLDEMVQVGAVSIEQREHIRGWFKQLPFRRTVDLEVILPGFPDGVGACLTGHPNELAAIEACASTLIFVSSLSLAVKSRFFHYINIEKTVDSAGKLAYRGHEFSMGPGVGVRQMELFEWDMPPSTATSLDGMLSLEWVYWFSKFLGFTIKFDGGVLYVIKGDIGASTNHVLPLGRLFLGLSF